MEFGLGQGPDFKGMKLKQFSSSGCETTCQEEAAQRLVRDKCP